MTKGNKVQSASVLLVSIVYTELSCAKEGLKVDSGADVA